MARRHALTDQQWQRIEGFLPGKAGDPGRTGEDNRRFVDAVIFVAKTGIPWADLPDRYGKPNSVWRRYDRWCEKGVWAVIFKALGEEELADELQVADAEHRELHLDSTTVKAHQVASTGRR